MLELQEKLKSAVTEIANDPGRIDNQVRRFLYEREALKLENQTGVPGYDVVKDILSEMSRLRADFASELGRFQSILLRSAGSRGSGSGELQASDLEGIWQKEDGTGLFDFRIADGGLRVAYCFDGKERLDSHMFDVTVAGRLLVARFAWFGGGLRGHILLNIESANRLQGGWWLDEDVPRRARNPGWALENASMLLARVKS